MRRIALSCATAALALVAGLSRADEIILNNGNTLTGKVVELDGKEIVFDSAQAGSIKIPVANIKSISTDAPVRAKLADGTYVDEKLVPAGDGKVNLGGQATDLRTIKKIRTKPVQWNGELTLGGTFTRGNSYSDSIAFGAHAERRTDLDRITLDGHYLYGKQKDEDAGTSSTNVDNWDAAGKYDYFLTDKAYLFGAIKVEHDRIADLEYRITPSGGYGYQWVDRSDLTFNTEIGVGYKFEKFENVPAGAEDSNDEVILRGAYHLTGKFNDKVGFFHNFEIYPSIEDAESFVVSTDIGIKADITERLFAQFKFKADYDSTPAADAHKFNLYYIVGVGWKF